MTKPYYISTGCHYTTHCFITEYRSSDSIALLFAVEELKIEEQLTKQRNKQPEYTSEQIMKSFSFLLTKILKSRILTHPTCYDRVIYHR